MAVFAQRDRSCRERVWPSIVADQFITTSFGNRSMMRGRLRRPKPGETCISRAGSMRYGDIDTVAISKRGQRSACSPGSHRRQAAEPGPWDRPHRTCAGCHQRQASAERIASAAIASGPASGGAGTLRPIRCVRVIAFDQSGVDVSGLRNHLIARQFEQETATFVIVPRDVGSRRVRVASRLSALKCALGPWTMIFEIMGS